MTVEMPLGDASGGPLAELSAEASDEGTAIPEVRQGRLPWKLITGVTVLLILATAAIYWQTHGFRYVTFDDGDYVYDNPHVNRGLSVSSIIWAFTALYINWHPLTWLSLMFDVELFGLNAGAQHLVNAAIHCATSVLLFVTFAKMTRRTMRSAFVAAIFAVHPLHVESVAWVSERKDVLCAFFEVMTILLYVRYTERQTWLRYAAVATAFACSLLSKPMAVTFPLILLLLDYWPLQRAGWPVSRQSVFPFLTEKAPLFVMSLMTCVLTVLAQKAAGAMIPLTRVPMSGRFANAIVAAAKYLGMTFWPSKLAVFYPIEQPNWTSVALSATVLLTITGLAFGMLRNRRYLIWGWLWYLIMLVPVIGIVQVGMQSMADRYMYLPMVGISVAVVWVIGDFAAFRLIAQALTALIGTVLVVTLVIFAHKQVSWWFDSETLYNHALAVTRNNYLAENNLGTLYVREGRHEEAMTHYRNAISMTPWSEYARANLAAELMDHGRLDEAFVQLTESLRLNPDQPLAEANLGAIYKARGDLVRARKHLEHSIQRNPSFAFAHSDLCGVLVADHEIAQALAQCREAIRLNPRVTPAWYYSAQALKASGDKVGARDALSTLLRIDPNYPGAQEELRHLRREAEMNNPAPVQ